MSITTSLNTRVTEYYDKYYSKVHSGSSTGVAASMMHGHLESYHRSSDNFPLVLELGAGDLQHFAHVKHMYDLYVASDIRPLSQHLDWMTDAKDQSTSSRRRFLCQFDAHQIPFKDETFDRVVATCLILHLGDTERALHEWMRVLKPKGVLDFLLPCEPGLMLGIYRSLFTRRRARKLGVKDFDLINALDHRSYTQSILEIVAALDEHYSARITWRPFPFLKSWQLNLQCVVTLTKK